MQCPKSLLHLKITAPHSVNQSIIYNLNPSNKIDNKIHIFTSLLINVIHSKIMKHKNIMNYIKITKHSNKSRGKTNWKNVSNKSKR